METIQDALNALNRNMSAFERNEIIGFDEFLKTLKRHPENILRNVFQVFHDMVEAYAPDGFKEPQELQESSDFVCYNCDQLFVEGTDHPFFADRMFANRLIHLAQSLRRGAQQNKIYIFKGPMGCGKSTFLNNLLKKFEDYANTDDGCRYEAVWHLDRRILERAMVTVDGSRNGFNQQAENRRPYSHENVMTEFPVGIALPTYFVAVPCPSHDHPILMVPKTFRRNFLSDLFKGTDFEQTLVSAKEYEWVLRDDPCTICSSIYDALLAKMKSPLKVFRMLFARPYRFNRRLGEGITVFNPGDQPMRQTVLSNPMLQKRINALFRDSNQVRYIFSRYAKTNNGIYALMDIKSHNTDRLIELHNIISEGLHKVEDIEENVKSLLVAVMNPEDEPNIQKFKSFSDRIEYIRISYVIDLNTEVEIYRNTFGGHIDEHFLPRVLHNFARIIISTRLRVRSDALLEWIGDPDKYNRFCDRNLQLLKMEILTGHIPEWLSEEDRKRLTRDRRRAILAEAEKEGDKGISGRDAIQLFNRFYSTFAREDRPIDMANLVEFFRNSRRELKASIPDGFLDSLLDLYNYTILQEIKGSLYFYNEEQISRDIQNYLFAVNFEPGSVENCVYTGEKLEITEEFLRGIEDRILGSRIGSALRRAFRSDTQKEYTTVTLTQEIRAAGKSIDGTALYRELYDRYVYNLKEKVLDPFLENENFRRAIKDYNSDDFKTYDKRIKNDVSFLIGNLCNRYGYTHQGAQAVCIYAIDNDLARYYGRRIVQANFSRVG